MKKLNHIWVFSDSIIGHEIQSRALTTEIAQTFSVYRCALRQPWLSFAPRIMPSFGKNIIWSTSQPDIKQPPDAIVSCGRRMAAVGKYHKRLTQRPHIHILNPTDNADKYDVIVCPQHDQLQGANVLQIQGSLHPINAQMLQQYKKTSNDKRLGLLLGSPDAGFFQNLTHLASQINNEYPDYVLSVCASRRTAGKYHAHIRQSFKAAKICWLNETDGENPYLSLLANSDVLMVTADSINMLAEACATDKTVIALAVDAVSAKHQRFVASLQQRLSQFGTQKQQHTALTTLAQTAQQVLDVLRKNLHKNLTRLD